MASWPAKAELADNAEATESQMPDPPIDAQKPDPREKGPRESGLHAFAPAAEPRNSACVMAPGAEPTTLIECLIAEFMGTAVLVLTVGVSAVQPGGKAPFAIGLMLATQIYTFGSISGANFNPAVTLAILFSQRGKITTKEACQYMCAQFHGGIAGGLTALFVTDQTFFFDYGPRAGLEGNNFAKSFQLELVFTLALCMVVLASGTSLDAPNDYFGFAIGGTVLASALACTSFDQGSFNPAVTVGINLANYAKSGPSPGAGAWFHFFFTPFLSAGIAALIFRGTRNNEYLSDLPIDAQRAAPRLLREKLLAEFVGTFFLVFTIKTAILGKSPMAPVAIGLMLAIQIYTYASVSGAMFNPAVTLAVFLSGRGKIIPAETAAYIGVQLVGGITGAGAASAFIEGALRADVFFDWKTLPKGKLGTSLVLEMLYTTALCVSVLATGTCTPNQYYGFTIGFTVLAAATACYSWDQGSFNPAVTLGINLFNADKPSAGAWIVFLLVPFLGSFLAALIFRITHVEEYLIEELHPLRNGGQAPSETE